MFPISVTALLGLLCVHSALAAIGTVPKSPSTPSRTGTGTGTSGSGTSSGVGSGGASGAANPPARSPSITSLADDQTIEHAVAFYNAMVTVIRDVVGKAKLTPIGDSRGLSYIESCSEHKAKRSKGAETTSGMYTIYPTGKVLDGSKQVWCDMDTDGGGWTVIQRRGYGTATRDKAEKFNRLWREYKAGFGTPLGDYWLGLDAMVALGSRCSNELEVVLTYFDDTVKTARYNNFTLAPESNNYRLHVGSFQTGNAGNVFEKHEDMIFHTSDKDSADRCATESHSGWWFVDKKNNKNYCAYVNLNGELKDRATDTDGMTWRYHSIIKGWSAPAIKKAEMKVRPKCPPSY